MTVQIKVDTRYSDKRIKVLEVAMKKIDKYTEKLFTSALPIAGRGLGRWSKSRNRMGAQK